MYPLRVGLIGDFDPHEPPHAAIPPALQRSAAAGGLTLESAWLDTQGLEHAPEQALAAFDALWCVPKSPYLSMSGALRGIRYARENGLPFLGTCGGFQHAVVEYARNVLGMTEAGHAEVHAGVTLPLVTKLDCPLVGTRGSVRLLPDTWARMIYDRDETTEVYHCRYGLNSHFRAALEQGGLVVSGEDAAGDARVLELPGHPFFVCTLFQPERSTLDGSAHPLIDAFVRAVGVRGSAAR
ncbi:MAG: hypothetical protein A2W00_05985 [Candidatus Eisenbacteria bacterium RBG_16_71_46]|nr:MAG: hypothetical protein A2W00_05985 [Candidatus Eisenbacteria bacterium RBG_16_71_46]